MQLGGIAGRQDSENSIGSWSLEGSKTFAFTFRFHQLFFNAQLLFETKTKSTCFYFSMLLLIGNLFKGDYDTVQSNGY